ncbi:ketopantoate reductase family protein [Streptomyces sp. NPDC015127]|uniref:ketopantoate reductase family protein n=1 Tax=Streptomyces sp. NPDC015127 TaxID=3364939 RepID=UPI003703058A
MGSIAIIGAGNVGQAIAGHMALQGHDVRLFDRWGHDLEPIKANDGGIDLVGEVDGHGKPSILTTDLAEAVQGAQVVIVATPAFAHAYMSKELAALLEPTQLLLFQPSVLGSGVELARMFAIARPDTLPHRRNVHQLVHLPSPQARERLHRGDQAGSSTGRRAQCRHDPSSHRAACVLRTAIRLRR